MIIDLDATNDIMTFPILPLQFKISDLIKNPNPYKIKKRELTKTPLPIDNKLPRILPMPTNDQVKIKGVTVGPYFCLKCSIQY
jgi:hypothetical protein